MKVHCIAYQRQTIYKLHSIIKKSHFKKNTTSFRTPYTNPTFQNHPTSTQSKPTDKKPLNNLKHIESTPRRRA